MKRIAIIAACASTLALAQADVARASYGAAFSSSSPVRIVDAVLESPMRIAEVVNRTIVRYPNPNALKANPTNKGTEMNGKGTALKTTKQQKTNLPKGAKQDELADFGTRLKARN